MSFNHAHNCDNYQCNNCLCCGNINCYVISRPSKDYSIDVDAIKDEQSLFVNARVILTNTGRQSLSDVLVDYGNRSEIIKMIQPGEKNLPLSS